MSTTVREDISEQSIYHPGSDVTPAGPETGRLTSLDVVRGVVMVLMAIDHVRVYAGVPAGGPDPGVFFTRWITHFAAPAFAFLAGTGAFLHGRKLGNTGALSRYLLTRGLFLVALELTVLRAAWTFNTDVTHYNLAGVIWMLGWCMVLMAAIVWLPLRVIGVLGVLLIVGQSALYALPPSNFAQFVYQGGVANLGGLPIGVLYVIVPWIGVMAAGYAFGGVMTEAPVERDRLCRRLGISMTVLFIIVATAMALASKAPEGAPLLFRILNQRKYPASPLFLLMTLGPTIALIPAAGRARGVVARVLQTFGRVPLFYYLLHIPLIHVLALGVSALREGRVNPWLFGNHPFDPPPVPEGYRWSLWLLYLVWAVAIAMLYPVCRWYAGVRARDTSGWTRYL